MQSSNHPEEPITATSKLKAIIEDHFGNNTEFVVLERFTTFSYTDEFAYAILDKKMQCIYFLADTVSSVIEQELTIRARHIPTVYGYLFVSNKDQLGLDGEFNKISETELLSTIRPVDFEGSFKNWRKDNNINIKILIGDLRNSLRTKYGISKEAAELLVCSSRNTLLRKTPFNSLFINKSDDTGGKLLYRYLSNNAFFRIIESSGKSKKALTYGLASICSMNDRWEYSFGFDSNGNQVYFRDSKVQDTFIMSLSKVSPDQSLDMWRLYGEDAKGICLEFEVKPGAPVYKVTYRKKYQGTPHYPFYVKDYFGNWFAFPLSKHTPIQLFSQKTKEFEIEKEARLIVIDEANNLLSQTKASSEFVHLQNGKWVSSSGTPFPILMMEGCQKDEYSYPAPLILKRVFIGPNASDPALKKAMIVKRLRELGVIVPVDIIIDFGYKPNK